MDDFENRLFSSSHHLLSKVFYWYRYVDDILCYWLGTQRQLNIFLNFLNSIKPSINFTLATNENKPKSINFLYLNISIVKNHHNFQIYRKPTHTDSLINYHSSHPWPHKLAAFNSMIHRLLKVPLSPENHINELKIIKQIASSNSYPLHLIENILKRQQLKTLIYTYLYPSVPDENTQLKWLRLPYLPHLSNKIMSLLPQNKYRIAFYTISTLFQSLSNSKDPTPKNKKSGVYLLECADCPTIYIGKTGRNFETRIHKEHFKFWKNNNLGPSNFADHLINNNHNFHPTINSLFLNFESFPPRLSQLEILQINKYLKDPSVKLCNDQLVFAANSPLLKL